LALLGATVVLACRDRKKGEKAVNDIRIELDSEASEKRVKIGHVLFMQLDLSNLNSVVDFCLKFNKRFGRLDILINNAGLNESGQTIHGLQQLFQVNFLGHYLLTKSLIPLLTSRQHSQAPARVINLSSVMHHNGQANFKLSAYSTYSNAMKFLYSYYSDSKLYMNLLTYELNKRYSKANQGERPIYAISANPGAVRSDIWRNVPIAVMWIYDLFMRIFYLSCKQGSATTVYAAANDFELTKKFEIPYLIPYFMPFQLEAFEMIGKFSGPRWGKVSLPFDHDSVASELYKFSESVCNEIFNQNDCGK
jgi:NAD(P)-dependent dehydrogenase (short-subunit alcohol dehydrogenase family)